MTLSDLQASRCHKASKASQILTLCDAFDVLPHDQPQFVPNRQNPEFTFTFGSFPPWHISCFVGHRALKFQSDYFEFVEEDHAMSRRFTLDDYLGGFMDEHTESAEDEIKLLVSDAQVQRVGLFFIECMGGILQSLASENRTPLLLAALRVEQNDQLTREVADEGIDEVNKDEDDFIN